LGIKKTVSWWGDYGFSKQNNLINLFSIFLNKF